MSQSRRTAVVLLNPRARKAASFDMAYALRRLTEWGFSATARIPGSVEDFLRDTREAVEAGTELLLVAGGDGTLRLAAGEMAGTETVLAALPVGTANVIAREVGLPSRWDAALDVHAAGQAVAMDLARANGEPFLMMAGIGWDADITQRVGSRLKRWLGPGAYAIHAAGRLPALHTRHVDIEAGDSGIHGDFGMVLVSNTRLYGGLVEFSPEATANDGLLDVCAIGPTRRGEGLVLGYRLIRHTLETSASVQMMRAPSVRILTAGMPVQLDGDAAGTTPLDISIDDRRVMLSVPAGRLPAVFGGQ